MTDYPTQPDPIDAMTEQGETVRHAVEVVIVDEGSAMMAVCARVYDPGETVAA